jgi:hypothetical protein
MTHATVKPMSIDDSAVYRIELQGALDRSWQDFLGEMEIQVRPGDSGPGVTTLTGLVADQAALSGILNFVCDLGMPLLSVTRVCQDGRSS